MNGELVYIPASGSMDDEDKFESQLEFHARTRREGPRQDRPDRRLRQPLDHRQMGEAGRRRPDRDQPGRRCPLGHLHHDLGHRPAPTTSPASRHARRRGEQGRRPDPGRLAKDGGSATIFTEMEEGWYRLQAARGLDRGHRRAGEVRPAPRPPRQLGRRRRRQRHRRRDDAGNRARPLGPQGQAQALGPHRLVAGPLHRALCRLHLVLGHLRARPRRQLRRAGQLRQPRLPLGDRVPERLGDVRGARLPRRGDPRGRRQGAALRAAAPRRRLLVQRHRPQRLPHAVLGHVRAPTARPDGLLPRRRLRHEHRLAHRERHARDRRPATSSLGDIKVYLLAVCRNANETILPMDWRATAREFQATIDDYQCQAGGAVRPDAGAGAADALLADLDGLLPAGPRAAPSQPCGREPGDPWSWRASWCR